MLLSHVVSCRNVGRCVFVCLGSSIVPVQENATAAALHPDPAAALMGGLGLGLAVAGQQLPAKTLAPR